MIASIEAAQGKSMLPESDSDSSDDERTSGPSSSPTLSARRSSVNSKASGPVELTEDGLNIPFKSILRVSTPAIFGCLRSAIMQLLSCIQSVMDHIKDVLDELKNITGPIADQAATHIHAKYDSRCCSYAALLVFHAFPPPLPAVSAFSPTANPGPLQTSCRLLLKQGGNLRYCYSLDHTCLRT